MSSLCFEDKDPRFTRLKPGLALGLLSKGLFYIRPMISTYLCTAVKSKTWQMIPTEKIGTRKYTDSGTNCIEMTIHATSIMISHRARALTPIECSTQQQHRLTWQHAIFCFLFLGFWYMNVMNHSQYLALRIRLNCTSARQFISQWMKRAIEFVVFLTWQHASFCFLFLGF